MNAILNKPKVEPPPSQEKETESKENQGDNAKSNCPGGSPEEKMDVEYN